MADKPKVIIAFHDSSLVDLNLALLPAFGAEPLAASNMEEIIRLVEQNPDAACYMDLNYGNRGFEDATPGKKVYDLLSDKRKFLGVSGNYLTIENAIFQGIPSGNVRMKPISPRDLDSWVKSLYSP